MSKRAFLAFAFLFTILIASGTSAQEFLWDNTFGGTGSESVSSVQEIKDASGNPDGYILAGTSSSGAGGSDAWLIKVDPSGKIQWQKTFGGTGSDFGFSVQQTKDASGNPDGYIIVGDSNSFGDGTFDILLIRTDLQGEISGGRGWLKTFPGVFQERAHSGQQTFDASGNPDGYIVVGSIRAGDNQDVLLMKTDPDGNLEGGWPKTFGGSSDDVGYSVQQTDDFGYIIVGTTWSSGAGMGDVYLIKTDSNGRNPLYKTFGGAKNDGGWSVQQTKDGGYIIAGETDSFGAGNSDVWLIKTDSDRKEEWRNTFGGQDYDGGRSVQQTKDGGYIITGYSGLINAPDLYLIKTDLQGEISLGRGWKNTFGSSGKEIGRSVQQTTDGGYIVAGYTELSGNSDLFLLKVRQNNKVRIAALCDGKNVRTSACGDKRLEFDQSGSVNIGGGDGNCNVICQQPFLLDSSSIWLKILRGRTTTASVLNPTGQSCGRNLGGVDQFDYSPESDSNFFTSENNCWFKPPLSSFRDTWTGFEFFQPPLTGVNCKVKDNSGFEWCGVVNVDTTGFNIHLRELRNRDSDWPIWYAEGFARSIISQASPTSVEADGITESKITATIPSDPGGIKITFSTTLGKFRSGGQSTSCTTTSGSCEVFLKSPTAGVATITASNIFYFSYDETYVTFQDPLFITAKPKEVLNDGFATSTIKVFTPDPKEGVLISLTAFSDSGGSRFVGSGNPGFCTTKADGTCSLELVDGPLVEETVTVFATSAPYATSNFVNVKFTANPGGAQLLISAQPVNNIPATGTDYSNITIEAPDNVFNPVLVTGVTSLGVFIGSGLRPDQCQIGPTLACTIKLASSTAGTANVFANAGGLGAPYSDSETIQVVFIDTKSIGVTAKLNPAPANGVTESTITVTLGDKASGVPISFTKTGLPESTFDTSGCTTDANGKCFVKLKSPKIGTATVTATATGYTSGTIDVVFIDVDNIFLEANPISAPANGVTESTITATLGDLASPVKITFTATGLPESTFDTPDCTTGDNGKCSVKIKSPKIGTATVTASANGYNDGTVDVEFTDPSQFTCYDPRDQTNPNARIPTVGDYCFYDGANLLGLGADKLYKCENVGTGDGEWVETFCATVCQRDIDGNLLTPPEAAELCVQNPPKTLCEDSGGTAAAFCYSGGGRQDCTVPEFITADTCKAVDVSGDTFVYWCDGGTGTATTGCVLCDQNDVDGKSELLCRGAGFNVCQDNTQKGDGLCVSFTPASECEGLGKTDCLNKACVWEEDPNPDICRACNYFTQCWTYDNLETCGANPCGIFYWDGKEGTCAWNPNQAPNECVFKVDDPATAGGIQEYVGGVVWNECVGGRRTGKQTVVLSDGTTSEIDITRTCPSIIPLVFLTKQTAIMIILLLVAYYFYTLRKNKPGKSTKSRRKRRK